MILAEDSNFTKSNTPLWVFSVYFCTNGTKSLKAHFLPSPLCNEKIKKKKKKTDPRFFLVTSQYLKTITNEKVYSLSLLLPRKKEELSRNELKYNLNSLTFKYFNCALKTLLKFRYVTQLTFTCSKLTTETLGKGAKYVQS